MARGDVEALIALTHPGAETLRSAVQGTYRGHEGAREFMRDNEENFEVFEPDYPDVEELPDGYVIAVGKIRIRGRGSGVETESPTAVVVEFRDGLMYRFKDYGDADAARAAVG
jgi:ketosteroid isomerase-like protein